MILADSYITVDPTWPWSLPGIGLPALAIVAVALIFLTLWTYVGARGATWRRIFLLLTLRLLALLAALLLVLRPSLATTLEDNTQPSRLLILVDASASMNITDEFDNSSRWDSARRILSSPAIAAALRKLATEQKVEVLYYQGTDELKKYDPNGKADGKRTDMGLWLHELWKLHQRDDLRGLVLLSDGADNGTRFAAHKEAAPFADRCPIQALGLGRPTTSVKQRDIALVDIIADPVPVPVKGKLTLRGIVNAPGFENSAVDVSLWVEDPKTRTMVRAGPVKREVLPRTFKNEIILTCDAPEKGGEMKVAMKIEPVKGEVTAANNEIITYVPVTQEGVSILWVEGRKRFESKYALFYGLGRDPRFRVYYIERLPGEVPPKGKDPYELDERQYDVIVIGDISATRFAGGDPTVFKKISTQVTDKKAGLLMMGGFDTFANSDWQTVGADIAALLPVDLNRRGQADGDVKLIPTKEGLEYVLRLADPPAAARRLWEKDLDPLDGMTHLGAVKPTGLVLATTEAGDPALVSGDKGRGRVLAFGGDTTWKVWRRRPETLPAHARFWKQVMLWLAQQEKSEGAAWITLDRHRLAAGSDQRVGMTVGLRSGAGLPALEPRFSVRVTTPGKQEIEVPISQEGNDHRGYFFKTDEPGEYVVTLRASGKESDGTPIPESTASARFLAYAEELESLRAAANHDHLVKLATAGGGRFFPADESKFLQYLEGLRSQRETRGQDRVERWPDWQREPPRDADNSVSIGDQIETLWSTTALPCLLVFVALLCVEWTLRRKWGLV